MIFKRYEKKYLLTKEQYINLLELIGPHLRPDEYGHSTICNIYYDTGDYELIRHSIERPIYKEKLRLRSYGVPNEDSDVFLEIKKKYNGIVYKRRISIPLCDAVEGIEQGYIEPVSGQEQITAEINYFLRLYNVSPAVFLAYDRDALYDIEDSEFRMTFDTNLRCRQDKMHLSEGDDGVLMFENGEVLLEVKSAGAYPFWLIHAMEKCGIFPASFSKYGSIYKSRLLPEMLEEHFTDTEEVCINA